ncbi:glycine oxidase, partial [Mesorhizobium sp. M1233]
VETGVGVRPAFPDNLPRAETNGEIIAINGLYRHGFLMAPAKPRQAADLDVNQDGTKERAHETDGHLHSA